MAASAGAIRAGSAYVEIFARDGQFQQAMTRMRTRMMALGTQMRQAGTSMVIGGAAIGAPMVMAVRQFVALDDALRATAAAAGVGESGLAAMRQSAQNLGLSFGMASDEVATLQVEIARAFGDKLKPGTDAFNAVTQSVLALAKASGTDGPTAAAIMTATLSQFGMGAAEAARVADVLTLAANATLNSVSGLGEALSYVGPVAADVGMSLEDTVAVLGTLGNMGIQGSEGGTAMRRLLTITGGEAEKLQKIFGVSFLDAAGNVRPLVDSLADVANATNGMASGERVKKFSDAFGLLGITSARAIGNTAADTRKLADALNGATGTATQQAQFMEAGVGGAMRRLFSSIKNVGESFGAALAPALMSAASLLQGFSGVVNTFIQNYPILSNIIAGATAGLFVFGVAAIAGGIALQGLATGLRVIQAVLPLLPALFSPIGLSIAAIGAAIAGGVIIARTLSPAFKQETDAIGAALMRLDFGAAWEVMNINLAIALVQMHQAFAQAFDLVKNTVIAASSFIGDMLIQGLDRFMGLFGADILTLQAGFEKLGVYFRAAFDWDFAVNGMSDALKKVEARVDEARQRAPTADARAEQRKQEREKAAEGRNEEIKKRDSGFEDTIKELRKDGARARDRALGKTEKPPEATVDEKGKPMKPKASSGAPGAPPPPPETKAEKDKGIVAAGNWSGVGLSIGPELMKLEDPAQRTADATERTAEAVGAIAVGQQGAAAGVAPMAAAAGVAPGEFQAGLDAVALAGADPNVTAEQLLAMQGGGAAAMPQPFGSGPAIAMNVVAPRAAAGQMAIAQGMQTATETSQVGIAFQQFSSEMVAAVNANTEVSKSIFGVLNKIFDKKPTEAAFT